MQAHPVNIWTSASWEGAWQSGAVTPTTLTVNTAIYLTFETGEYALLLSYLATWPLQHYGNLSGGMHVTYTGSARLSVLTYSKYFCGLILGSLGWSLSQHLETDHSHFHSFTMGILGSPIQLHVQNVFESGETGVPRNNPELKGHWQLGQGIEPTAFMLWGMIANP